MTVYQDIKTGFKTASNGAPTRHQPSSAATKQWPHKSRTTKILNCICLSGSVKALMKTTTTGDTFVWTYAHCMLLLEDSTQEQASRLHNEGIKWTYVWVTSPVNSKRMGYQPCQLKLSAVANQN